MAQDAFIYHFRNKSTVHREPYNKIDVLLSEKNNDMSTLQMWPQKNTYYICNPSPNSSVRSTISSRKISAFLCSPQPLQYSSCSPISLAKSEKYSKNSKPFKKNNSIYNGTKKTISESTTQKNATSRYTAQRNTAVTQITSRQKSRHRNHHDKNKRRTQNILPLRWPLSKRNYWYQFSRQIIKK